MWISLIGFMGSGKSTVARLVSERTFVPAVDLDERIAESAGRSVAEIFQQEGEDRFRQLESEALTVLPREGDGILACGGGVVERESNRGQLRQRGPVVWLDTTWENLHARISAGPANERPLVQQLGWEGLKDLYLKRRPLYAATAHFRLRTDRDDPEIIARRVTACRFKGDIDREVQR